MSDSGDSDIESATGSDITADPGDTGSVFKGLSNVTAPPITNRPRRAPKKRTATQAQLNFSQVFSGYPNLDILYVNNLN